MQVRSSILGTDLSFSVKTNTKIRSINLFFNDQFMLKEIIPLAFRHDFIVPDLDSVKKR
jgi:hypothetical protein